MKKKSIITLIVVCVLVSAVFLAGCNNTIKSDLLTKEKTAMSAAMRATAETSLRNNDNQQAYLDFSGELLSNCFNGNTMISPLSVYFAMAMLCNGASENTLAELQSALNMPLVDMNNFCGGLFADYMEGDISGINVADSIWVKEGFEVKQAFLDVNVDYYGAEVYRSAFDKRTLTDINNWVNNNTDGMIKKIIDRLSSDAVMVLINTLLFEMGWKNKYYDYTDDTFTELDGSQGTKDFIKCTSDEYYQTENAEAFSMSFDNDRFSFLGILPNETVDYDEYVNNFSGQELKNLLSSVSNDYDVYGEVPKMKYDFSVVLNDIFKKMGIKDAFDSSAADFSGISSTPIFVSSVLHKTAIELDKNGVKAAAATAIILDKTSALPETIGKKTVFLNRPFMFCIMDNVYNVPLFIGAVTNI